MSNNHKKELADANSFYIPFSPVVGSINSGIDGGTKVSTTKAIAISTSIMIAILILKFG